MKYLIRTLLLSIFIHLTAPYARSEGKNENYQRSHGEDSVGNLKPGCIASNVIEINPRFAPQKHMTQSKTGTCYGHAAYYLLYYLNNESRNRSDQVPSSLDLIDVLAQGCHGELPNEGNAYAVLHNLKGKLPQKDRGFDIDQIFELNRYLESDACTTDCTCTRLNKITQISPSAALLTDDVAAILATTAPKKRVHPLLFAHSKAEERLPPYNVEVIEAENPDDFLKAMRSAIQSNVTSRPVTLAYDSPSEPDSHEVVVTGVRKLCCGTQCAEEWKIQNSWKPEDNGWFNAEPLSEVASSMSVISACDESHGSTTLPPCIPEILGRKPLTYLFHAGDFETLKKMVVRNKDLLDSDLLVAALDSGNLDIIQYIVEKKPSLLKELSFHAVLVSRAIELGRIEVLHWIVERKPEFLQEMGHPAARSLLHRIEYEGQFPLFQFWIEKWPALLHQKDTHGQTTFDRVLEHVANLPLESGSYHPKILDILHYLYTHHPKELTASLATMKDEATDIASWTAYYGRMDLLHFILGQYPETLTKIDSGGLNLAQSAAFGGHRDILQSLLEKHPDFFKAKDISGTSLAHFAVMSNDPVMLEYVLSLSPDFLLAENDLGENLAFKAAKAGSLKTLQLLLSKHPLFIKSRDKQGLTLAHAAADRGKLKTLRYLLEQSADLMNDRDEEGNDLVQFAALANNSRVLAELFHTHPAELKKRDTEGQTLPIFVVRNGDLKAFITLLSFYPNDALTSVDGDGQTLAHFAALADQFDIFVYLIKNSPGLLETKNKHGTTPATLAAENHHSRLVDWIRDNYPEALLTTKKPRK